MVREQVERSVVKRTEPGQTGILLSGGLDSTSIAALSPIGRDRLRAYSAVFPSHRQSDESEEAYMRHVFGDRVGDVPLVSTRAEQV